MDWLDQYLNELDKPTPVAHFPPDKQSWNRPNPTKQQAALIQDATIADMIRMRLIQEARQAEVDAGMGGGYDAGSAAKENPVVPSVAVPGAPVLTSLGTGNAELSAFFTAPVSDGGSAITNYKFSINKGISFIARSPASVTSPIKITGLTNGTEYDVRIRAVNAIGDGTVSNALSGTPVAPAPSGIPVASVSQVSFVGEVFGFNDLLYKYSPSYFVGSFSPQNDYNIVVSLTFSSGLWTVEEVYTYDGNLLADRTSTASGVAEYIPTSGWSNNDFTITAA